MGPSHSLAVDTADVHQWPAVLREVPDRRGVIYRSACLSVHPSHHALNIFGRARLDHDNYYRTYVRMPGRVEEPDLQTVHSH